MNHLRLRLGLLLTAFALVLSACGGGGGTPNTPPTAEDSSIRLAAGQTSGTLDLATLINDTETVTGELELSISTEPESGDAVIAGTIVTYTPDADSTATIDSFEYTVTDAGGDTATGTISVRIARVTDPNPTVNDPPVADDGAIVIVEGATTGTLDLSTVASDPETALADLTFTVENGANGTAAVDGAIVTYTLVNTEATADTFEYTVSDGELSATGTVTVSVNDGDGTGSEPTVQDGSEENPFVTYNGLTIYGNPTGDVATDATFDFADNAVYEGSAGPINFPVSAGADNKNFTVTMTFTEDVVGSIDFPATATLEYTQTGEDAQTLYFEIRGPSIPATPAEAGPGGLIYPAEGDGALVLQPNQILLGQGTVTNAQSGLVYIRGGDAANRPTVESVTLADGVSVGGVIASGGITGEDLAGNVTFKNVDAEYLAIDGSEGSVLLEDITITGNNDGVGLSLNGVNASSFGGVTVQSLAAEGRGVEIIDSNANIFRTTVAGDAADAFGFYFVNETLAQMRVDASINTVNLTGAGTTGFFADSAEGTAASSFTFTGADNVVTAAAKGVTLECTPVLTGGFFVGATDTQPYGCGLGQNRGD